MFLQCRSCSAHRIIEISQQQQYQQKRKVNLPSNLHQLNPKLSNMHAKATVDGTVIADTDNFEFVEGNIYFPISSVKDKDQTLTPASRTSQCPWKGEGHYYDVNVNGKTIPNGAWYYPHPLPKATHIKDHVAFGEFAEWDAWSNCSAYVTIDKSYVQTEKEKE